MVAYSCLLVASATKLHRAHLLFLQLALSQELAADSRLDASFAFHAVQDLRNTLRSIGSDLVVRCGDAAAEVAKVVEEAGASHVFFHAR